MTPPPPADPNPAAGPVHVPAGTVRPGLSLAMLRAPAGRVARRALTAVGARWRRDRRHARRSGWRRWWSRWRYRDVALRRARVAGGVLLTALAGGLLGWLLAPSVTTTVGPLEVAVRVAPSLQPGVSVDLPPAGRVVFDTHDLPVAVSAHIVSVDLDSVAGWIASPRALQTLQRDAPQVLRDATLRAAVIASGCSVAGALAVGVLVYRSPRRTAQTMIVAGGTLLTLCAATAVTFDPTKLSQPHFTGVLSRAPYLAATTEGALHRLESYRSGIADFVKSVTGLYAASENLPTLSGPGVPPGSGRVTTVLHISDIHLNPLGFDLAARLVRQFRVDAVVDTGDVTTWGTDLESSTLGRIGALGVPYVFVRGNHDSTLTARAVAQQPGALVLDNGQVAEVAGLRFAGIGDPRFTPAGEGTSSSGSAREAVLLRTTQLADAIRDYAARNPGAGVDVALVHDPSALDPLYGRVPLVLAGHLHKRVIRVDPSGTRIMVEGSTGGAGITAAGLTRLQAGKPVPLSATLLYFARSGARAHHLLGYDQVSVGGLGMASVTVERSIVEETEERPLVPPAPGRPEVARAP